MLNLINILKSLIKFNTESKTSNLPLISFTEEILKEKGFKTDIQTYEVGGVKKANLLAFTSKEQSGLLLSGHTDTVPVGSGWQTNPFKLTKIGSRYYGLGVADVKGFLASMITAACQVIEGDGNNLKKPLALVFTFDEETNFAGIKKLLSAGLIKPKFAIVGEPTNLTPVVAHKGVVELSITFFGKEAHSSNPRVGINAIEAANYFIQELSKVSVKLQAKQNKLFNPSYSTISIGKIKGGTAINKVPDFCIVDLEYRAVSEKDQCLILSVIEQIAKALLKNKKTIKVDIKKTLSALPFSSSLDKRTIATLEKITKRESSSVSFAAETAIYEQYKIPALLLGPGDIKRAHRPNEYITEKELKQAVEIYSQIIKQTCF